MPTSKSERRSRSRLPVHLPVSIASTQCEPITGVIRDLSMSGIFLYANAKILVGSELEMVLTLPEELTNGERRWVCCRASVVRVEDGGEGGRFGVAARIHEIAALPEIPV